MVVELEIEENGPATTEIEAAVTRSVRWRGGWRRDPADRAWIDHHRRCPRRTATLFRLPQARRPRVRLRRDSPALGCRYAASSTDSVASHPWYSHDGRAGAPLRHRAD